MAINRANKIQQIPFLVLRIYGPDPCGKFCQPFQLVGDITYQKGHTLTVDNRNKANTDLGYDLCSEANAVLCAFLCDDQDESRKYTNGWGSVNAACRYTGVSVQKKKPSIAEVAEVRENTKSF